MSTQKVIVCKKCGGTERTPCGKRCAPCRKASVVVYQKTYYDKNKTARHANTAAWYARNKDANRSKTNADYARNKAKRDATKRAYRIANPEKMYLYTMARKAKKLNATPSWANRFFVEQAYDIARVRSEMLGSPWEVDHIVPLQSRKVCGLHVEHNLRVIPRTVNRKKSNSHWPDMP